MLMGQLFDYTWCQPPRRILPPWILPGQQMQTRLETDERRMCPNPEIQQEEYQTHTDQSPSAIFWIDGQSLSGGIRKRTDSDSHFIIFGFLERNRFNALAWS